jgi:signal-transduction protein with cAMP-binding, CBS, and nucleotidyltransferase domain
MVRHMMTPRLEAVAPTTTAEELRALAEAKGIRHVLVADSDEGLLGIISDRDLLGRTGKFARDLMTANPISVTPDTPVCTALTLLFRHRISCLPIVEEGKACGILTTTDAILALQCLLQTLERAGTLTQDMLQHEIQSEGTLQNMLQYAEGNCANELSTSA